MFRMTAGVEFIHAATGRFAIICDVGGVIVAAKVASRVGNVHAGARRMLQEGQSACLVTVAEEEASGGAMKAGCNLPIHYRGELIGSIGVAGDPGFATMMQGYLESSNVDPVREITELISAQRAYEMNSKVITAASEMLSTVSKGMNG